MTQTEQLGLILFLFFMSMKFSTEKIDEWGYIKTWFELVRITINIACFMGAMYLWVYPVIMNVLRGVK